MSFTANLTGATGATLGSPTTTTVTIVDDETPPPGTLQFKSASYSVNENAGSIRVYVSRTNGTASAGSDYTAASGTLPRRFGSKINDQAGLDSESGTARLTQPSFNRSNGEHARACGARAGPVSQLISPIHQHVGKAEAAVPRNLVAID